MPYITAMTDRTSRPRPVVLCILDGWGHRADPDDNAILRRPDTPSLGPR